MCRDPDDDRVQPTVQPDGPRFDGAQKRFSVRHRRRPRIDRKGRELARQVAQDAVPHDPRKPTEHACQRRAGDAAHRLRVEGVTLEQAAQHRRVERQRDPEHRDATREGLLQLDRGSPPARSGRLEERIRVGGAKRLRSCGGEERSRPAVQNRLGGGDRDDQVGLDQSGMDAKRHAAHLAEVDEVRVLDVVHLDLSVKPPPELGRDELLKLALAGSSREPSRDEDGLPLERQIRRD